MSHRGEFYELNAQVSRSDLVSRSTRLPSRSYVEPKSQLTEYRMMNALSNYRSLFSVESRLFA